MKIIVATTNEGKLAEIERILSPLGFEVCPPPRKLEVEESGDSFLENAHIKARAYHEEFGTPTLADDSGLVVSAIAPYPGVYSSRFYSLEFGGVEEVKTDKDTANIRKLLRLLEKEKDRNAKFVACVVLYRGDKGMFSFGECKGIIAHEPRGNKGFGYDPVFIPEGFDKTMAEVSPEEKDSISHRGKALRNLVDLIESLKDL